MFQHRYRPCRFDFIENIDLYASGGLHPVSIGDVFADGRYKVLHKLGFGGSSTIWLARYSVSGILVALKVLAAYKSTKPKEELVISQKLDVLIASTHDTISRRLRILSSRKGLMERTYALSLNLLDRACIPCCFLAVKGGLKGASGSGVIWLGR